VLKALVLIAATAATARAQPALTAPAEQAAPTSVSFVELGGSIGSPAATPGATGASAPGKAYAGVEVEGGYRITGKVWWAHAAVATASTSLMDPPGLDRGHDRFSEVRAGLELRPCSSRGTLCGIFGVDGGYRHEIVSDGQFRDNRSGGEAVLRLGLDIAVFRSDLRLRPVVEGTSTRAGDSSALTIGAALLW
jgi:hypothetical protein